MAEDGTGKTCAEDLGVGWKISPSVNIEADETFELANIQESGIIKHIWITDNCPVNRALIIRLIMFWAKYRKV